MCRRDIHKQKQRSIGGYKADADAGLTHLLASRIACSHTELGPPVTFAKKCRKDGSQRSCRIKKRDSANANCVEPATGQPRYDVGTIQPERRRAHATTSGKPQCHRPNVRPRRARSRPETGEQGRVCCVRKVPRRVSRLPATRQQAAQERSSILTPGGLCDVKPQCVESDDQDVRRIGPPFSVQRESPA